MVTTIYGHSGLDPTEDAKFPEPKYRVVCRSCILNMHFNIQDHDKPSWSILDVKELLKGPSYPFAIVMRLLRSLLLIEASTQMHKFSLKKFSFELLDSMLRPNSPYSVVLDIECGKKEITLEYVIREKMTPFDNVAEKMKSNIVYGKGAAIF